MDVYDVEKVTLYFGQFHGYDLDIRTTCGKHFVRHFESRMDAEKLQESITELGVYRIKGGSES